MPQWWWYCISSTRPHPRIVAAVTRNTSINMRIILMTVIGLALGLFMLYCNNSFPWLTSELRGCVYYCQHLTVIAVSLVHTLSSSHWCLRAFQWNKHCPRIAATQKRAASSHVVWLKNYGSSFSWKLFLTALCCHKVGTTERLHSWYCGKLDQPKIN